MTFDGRRQQLRHVIYDIQLDTWTGGGVAVLLAMPYSMVYGCYRHRIRLCVQRRPIEGRYGAKLQWRHDWGRDIVSWSGLVRDAADSSTSARPVQRRRNVRKVKGQRII